jgi:asparagine synthase (glutamine-hydrolysing)
MCGLIGEVNFDNSILNVNQFKSNIDFLKNRGPDDTGYWKFKNIIQLGFRRLSIVDPGSRSNQPMLNDENKISIVFNGEIYNFKEIKSNLEKKKIIFKTESDTEVILALYSNEGPDGLKKLRGMFSIAICDLDKKKVFFLRDPFGIKPLYYFYNQKKFIFSSTVKSLLSFEIIKKKICKESLNFFYFFGSVKENQTIIEKVKSFEPGYLYEVDFDNNFSKKKLFDIGEIFSVKQKVNLSIKEHFEKNLLKHAQSDVPVAILLSGGLDSSAILSYLIEKKIDVTPFTLGFEEFKGIEDDEITTSEKFCKLLGIKHNKIYLSNDEILDDLENFFKNMDQPSYDGLNTYLITKFLNNKNFKVAISGLGADELLGGYNTFIRMRFLHHLKFLYNSSLFKKFINFINKIFKKNKYIIFFALLSKYNNPYQIYLLLRSKKNNLHKIEKKYLESILTEKTEYSEMSLNDLTSLLEIKIYMKNQLLKDADWAGMSNSVEVRVPFVDYDFLEALKKSKFKINNGKKFFFKNLFNIPEFIIRKKKTGFNVPYKQIVDMYNKKYRTNFENWSEICLKEYFSSLNIKKN